MLSYWIKNKAVIFLIFALFQCYIPASLASNNFQRGRIYKGFYFSEVKDTNGHITPFRIKLPATGKFDKIRFRDFHGLGYAAVWFQGRDYDLNLYKLTIQEKPLSVPFEVVKKKALPRIISRKDADKETDIKKVYEKKIQFQGNPAYYFVYTFHFPATLRSKEETITQAIFLIDFKKYMVVIEASASNNQPFKGLDINDSNREQVIDRSWKPMMDYVNSFAFIK